MKKIEIFIAALLFIMFSHLIITFLQGKPTNNIYQGLLLVALSIAFSANEIIKAIRNANNS